MRKHWPVFYIVSLFLVLVISTIAQAVANLGLNSFISIHSTNGKQWASVVAELVALLIWWLLNKAYFHATIGWGRNRASAGRNWLFLLPVIVVVVGDSTLGAQYVLTPQNIGFAILMGLAVGLLEEYVFRGLLVSYLYGHFRVGAMVTACLSGVGFGLVHLVNGLSTGNWTNTLAQVLMAIGLGFFLAVVYLITNNLWIPVIFHGIIDAFDQIAFGTLSNNAGTSMTTAVLYFVAFVVIGIVTIARGTVKLDHDRMSFSGPSRSGRQVSFSRSTSEVRVSVSPVKSLIAVLLILAELAIGTTISRLSNQTLKTTLVVALAAVVFLIVVWLYRDVLGQSWAGYRAHLFRNLVLNIVYVVILYVLIAAVRRGLPLITGASMATSAGSMLSMQTVQAASVGVLASITVLMAPFTEEIVFRHVLFYQWKGHRIFMLLMFFVSSIAFGLVHWNNFNGDMMQMIPYMFAGAFFALIYYFSKNIWQNIMTHFFFDFVQFAAALMLLIVAIAS